MQDFKLYLILDVEVLSSLNRDPIETARQAICAGVDILQLRAKDLTDHQILKIGQAIKKVCSKGKALFLLNDRPDLAHILDIDGVHLGQDDLPIKEARKILGKNKIIGFSTHSTAQAIAAEKQGVDYIGLGPIFTTETKPDFTPIGIKVISKVKAKINIPFLAIGGINLENIHQVLASGSQRIAICRAIVAAKNISLTIREFKQRLRPLL